MIREHAAAVLALLDADNTAPALNVYDGEVPAGIEPRTSPYVLCRFSEIRPELNYRGVTHVYGIQVTTFCVAGSDATSRTVAGRVRAALIDVAPTVAGRKCFPIRWEESADMRLNERTGSAVATLMVAYSLRSVPSS